MDSSKWVFPVGDVITSARFSSGAGNKLNGFTFNLFYIIGAAAVDGG